jgi:uncharacterized protein with GYD domain
VSKYLVIASYSSEGIRGVLAKGGNARKTAVEDAVAQLGGSLECFYFGFGADDAYVIVDLPDNVAAAALGLQVGASGMASARTVVLLSPDEVDRAGQAPSVYRPPGS